MSEAKKAILKTYEVYTVSGKRLFIKACDVVTNFPANDISFYDEKGGLVAQFRLNNIEGWLVEKGETL